MKRSRMNEDMCRIIGSPEAMLPHCRRSKRRENVHASCEAQTKMEGL
jgi:hypothetical protein